jgi:hypothetical protein
VVCSAPTIQRHGSSEQTEPLPFARTNGLGSQKASETIRIPDEPGINRCCSERHINFETSARDFGVEARYGRDTPCTHFEYFELVLGLIFSRIHRRYGSSKPARGRLGGGGSLHLSGGTSISAKEITIVRLWGKTFQGLHCMALQRKAEQYFRCLINQLLAVPAPKVQNPNMVGKSLRVPEYAVPQCAAALGP